MYYNYNIYMRMYMQVYVISYLFCTYIANHHVVQLLFWWLPGPAQKPAQQIPPGHQRFQETR